MEQKIFKGYCVYIEDSKLFFQIIGIISKEVYVDTIKVSFDNTENQAIVYNEGSLYTIHVAQSQDKFELGDQLSGIIDDYGIFISDSDVFYHNKRIKYLSILKNFEVEVLDNLLDKIFTYTITNETDFAFATYSNPINLSLIKDVEIDSRIDDVFPINGESIQNYSIKLVKNIGYLVNDYIKYSRIIDSSGYTISNFSKYKNVNGNITIEFDTAISLNCTVFIPDNSISFISENSQKGPGNPGISSENGPIHYILSGYTYVEPEPDPEPEPEPEPLPEPDPEPQTEEIEYYVNPIANSTVDITFNGLFKYTDGNNIINSNIRRVNDTIFLDKSLVNKINILPQLRTRAHFVGEQGDRNIIYDNGEIKVLVSKYAVDEYGTDINEILDIPYNLEYAVDTNNIRLIKLKIEFNVSDTYHLEKTVQFYCVSSNLFTQLSNSNSFSQENYNSIIDILTGEPAVVKYGCLLLTGHDIIESVETNELDENDLPITKLVAELVPTTKVRMGNLKGIYNETFGTNLPHGFGLYGESVYLTGNFYLNNGKSLVDISNDVTMAVGNINRILNTLANLDSNFLNSIYNLTLSLSMMASTLAASFSSIISNNNDAIFKLGKDYSIWSLGNAGVAIINPNATYTESGDVDDSTVGDNDEYVLLQGESVQISTSVIKNDRLKVIVCNIDPLGFTYPLSSGSEQLYYPDNSDPDNPDSGIKFAIGWIENNSYIAGEKHIIYPENSSVAKDYYRYVALEKTVNIDSSDELTQVQNPTRDNCNIYSFTTSRIVSGSNIYKTFNGSTTFDSANSYYVIPDILVAGLFEDGKFNANLINVQNLVAVNPDYKDNDFNVDNQIKYHPNHDDHNYPTIDLDQPFAVISGTTGKITALGVDLKEATVGDSAGKHIHITDNQGSSGNESRNESGDTGEPGIYIKNENVINTRITGKIEDLHQEIYNRSDKQFNTYGMTSPLSLNADVNRKVRVYNRSTNLVNDFTDSATIPTILDLSIQDNTASIASELSGYNITDINRNSTKVKFVYNNVNYTLNKYWKLVIRPYCSGVSFNFIDGALSQISRTINVPEYVNSQSLDSDYTYEFNAFTHSIKINGIYKTTHSVLIAITTEDSSSYCNALSIKSAEFSWDNDELIISKLFVPNFSMLIINIIDYANNGRYGIYSAADSGVWQNVNLESNGSNIYYNYDVDKVEYSFNDNSLSKVEITQLYNNPITIPKKSSATFTLTGYQLSSLSQNLSHTITSYQSTSPNTGSLSTLFKTPISCCINIGIGLAEYNLNNLLELIHDLSSKTYAIHGVVTPLEDDKRYEIGRSSINCKKFLLRPDGALYIYEPKTKITYAEDVSHKMLSEYILNEFNNLDLSNTSIYYNNDNVDKEVVLVFFIKFRIIQNVLRVLDYLTSYGTTASELPREWSVDNRPQSVPTYDMPIHQLPNWDTPWGARAQTSTLDIYSKCYGASNVWDVNNFPYKIGLYAKGKLTSGHVTIHYNNFNTNILGNGFGSGFNNQNLISVNTLDQDTNLPYINANLLSSGNGIVLNNGFYESLGGVLGRHYFTILNGEFTNSFWTLGNYIYSGYSLIDNGTETLEYKGDNVVLRNYNMPSLNEHMDTILSGYILGAAISQIFSEDPDFTLLADISRLYNIYYSNKYDFYYGQTTYLLAYGDSLYKFDEPGLLGIIFGKQWEQIFDLFPNINESYFKVNIVTDDGVISPNYKFINFSKKITARSVSTNQITTSKILLPSKCIFSTDSSNPNEYPNYSNNEDLYVKYGLCIKLRNIFKENLLSTAIQNMGSNGNFASVFSNNTTTDPSKFKITVEFGAE